MSPKPRLFETVLRYADLRLHTASSGPIDGLETLILTLDYDGLAAAAELRCNIAYLTGVEPALQRALTYRAVKRFRFSSDPSADRERLDEYGFDPRSRTLLEAALVDAAARLRGCSAAELLGGPPGAPASATNQTLFHDRPDRVLARAKAYVARGFRDLKLRIGFGDPDTDVRLLYELRASLGPGVRLSADVNGTWSLAQARARLGALAEIGITYLEQPLATGAPGDLIALAREAPFPVMLDESLQDRDERERLHDAGVPFLLHLKLVKTGGLDRMLEMARRAHAAGHEVMVGQMNEGALATAAALSAVAAIAPRHAELYGADGLVNDPARGLRYSDGRVASAHEIGIGAVVDGGPVPTNCSEIDL